MRVSDLLKIIPVPAFFFLTSSDMIDACIDYGTGSTVLQVFVAVLVGGLFAANHFKHKISTIYHNLCSKDKDREASED
jgi:hypothetical protein